MHCRILFLVLASLVGFSGRASAVIGTLDDVPAATLLLPYFEVDLNNLSGVTTLVTVRNVDSAPVVAHVTIWSNLSVPVLDFDIYLTGFDTQVFNLRDVVQFGNLPRTAPNDVVSPRGARSGPHQSFSCAGILPYSNPAISGAILTHLQNSLTGRPSALFGNCAATPTDHAVGYLTIDAVNRCNLSFPTDPGYFAAGGQGIASNRNVLFGSWFMADSQNNWAQGDTLVHLEASADDPRTSTPGSYTFYGRYTGGTAVDNRERLPARWNAPLDAAEELGESNEMIVWRDSGRAVPAFTCGSLPAPFPLGSTEISVLSEEGLSTALAAATFPYEAQKVTIDQAGSSLRLDLDTSTGAPFDPAKQAHVTALRRTAIVSTARSAVQEAGTGVLGTADAAPGASLLLPYFEADTADPSGVRTAMTVRNAAAAPVLARVVLWTDLSVPTLAFDLYLPAFGSRVVDLQEIFDTGWLPASGPAPLPGCALPPAPLSAATLGALNAAHTGLSSQLFGGLCAGTNHGDGVARGYVTVDVMTQCTTALPGQPGYFGENGVAGFANVLWGDYVLEDQNDLQAHGGTLVHLQASTTDPLTATSGRPTFYSRYVNWSAADHREALGSSWGISSLRGGAFDGGASALIWRDSGLVQPPFACASAPGTFPLAQGMSLHFDESGRDVPVPPTALGLEAQKRLMDWTGPAFGWLYLDLGTRTGAFSQPPLQGFATSFERATGRFGISIPGVQLPAQWLLVDGFESGNFVGWTFKNP